jgi:DNA ligase-1
VYDILKDSVVSTAGKEVRFEPGLVFEVGYSEIQASQTYDGGFALRFPRFMRIRDDKDVTDIETLDSIRVRYQRQANTAQVYKG